MHTIRDAFAQQGSHPELKTPVGAATEGTDGGEEEDFKPLTAQEAQAWRSRQRIVSVWRALGWQALVAALVAGVIAVAGYPGVAVSFGYGAACVVVPAAVMAWGVKRGRLARSASAHAKGSLVALLLWEGVKLTLSVLMMVVAPKVLSGVDWLALLVGLVVVIKINGLALWWASRTG